jgi:surface antigen
MGEKGGYQLRRTHLFLLITIVVLALIRTWTATPLTFAGEDFKHPPYPLQTVGGGNCVWLTWEMAWLRWGFFLPVVGHACQWTTLDGVKLQQGGRVGILGLVDQPIPDSIMILPPSRQYPYYVNGDFGHLAWVVEVSSQGIIVIESTIFPEVPGQEWRGCRYWLSEYDLASLENASFLCLAEVLPAENDPAALGNPALPAWSANGTTSISVHHIWQSCRDMWSYTLLSLQLLLR